MDRFNKIFRFFKKNSDVQKSHTHSDNPESNKMKVEVKPELRNIFSQFVDKFGKPERVYYPACGLDATPIVAFPDSEVVLLDIEEGSINAIRELYPKANVVHLPAERYVPGKDFDLVFDSHSYAPFEAEIKHLKVGGHLIISNKTSEKAFTHGSFRLVGVVVTKYGPGTSGSIGFDFFTDDLSKYEEKLENPPKITFSNKRKLKADYYIFERV